MTQTAMLSILGVIAVLELLVIIVGSIWSANQNLWIRTESQKMVEKLGGITDAVEKVVAINDRIIDKLRSTDEMSREQRRELNDLLRDQRREQNQLLLDIERRIQDCVKQTQLQHGGGTNVNFNHDIDRANVNTGGKQSNY